MPNVFFAEVTRKEFEHDGAHSEHWDYVLHYNEHFHSKFIFFANPVLKK